MDIFVDSTLYLGHRVFIQGTIYETLPHFVPLFTGHPACKDSNIGVPLDSNTVGPARLSLLSS